MTKPTRPIKRPKHSRLKVTIADVEIELEGTPEKVREQISDALAPFRDALRQFFTDDETPEAELPAPEDKGDSA